MQVLTIEEFSNFFWIHLKVEGKFELESGHKVANTSPKRLGESFLSCTMTTKEALNKSVVISLSK